MPVNTNTLIHFTNSISNIESILTNNFLPRLSLEDYSFIIKRKVEQRIAIPMVCFCDIPLHLIRQHMKEYGYYGIGMKKAWAINNGINPIIYLDRRSKINSNFTRLNQYLVGRSKEAEGENEFRLMWNLLAYMKPYKGISKKSKKRKVFYDEREWRFVPDVITNNKKSNSPILLLESEYVAQKDTVNVLLKEYPLRFSPNDIKYIIVDNEDEIYSVIQMVNSIKSPRYSSKEVEILKSKIITAKYMLEDF